MSYSFDFGEVVESHTAKVGKEIKDAVSEMMADPAHIAIVPSNIQVRTEIRPDGQVEMVATMPMPVPRIKLKLSVDDTPRPAQTVLENLAQGFSMAGCPIDTRGLR